MHGRSLGAGWTVETTYVNDPFMISHTPTWHISSTQTFYGSLADYDCATVSIAEAQSGPALLAPSISGTIYTEYQVGICNPGGNPLGSMFGGSDPVNIPAKAQTASIFVPLWSLNCSWTLRYNAKRDFTEMAVITVNASTQAVLTSPTVEQDTLLIKMDGEVGEPRSSFTMLGRTSPGSMWELDNLFSRTIRSWRAVYHSNLYNPGSRRHGRAGFQRCAGRANG